MNQTENVMLSSFCKECYTGMNVNTCGFHMVRELRVCVLAFDVSSSELEPSKQQMTVQVSALYHCGFNLYIQQL